MVSPAAAGSDQKTVGPNTDQVYNADTNMCSRESCSVLPSRLIASLLIFLAAFLIGLLAARFAVRNKHNPWDIRDYASHSTCLNQDGVDFWRAYTKVDHGNAVDPLLIVSNHGSGPVSFSIDSNGRLVDFDLDYANSEEMYVELQPGDAHVFSAANSQKLTGIYRLSTSGYNFDSLDFSFSYLLGDSMKIKKMHVVFDADEGFPSKCTSN